MINELLALGDRGGLAASPGGRPDGRGQARDGRLWLGDDTVPVVHGQRLAADPPDVVRFPVAVADDLVMNVAAGKLDGVDDIAAILQSGNEPRR